MVLAFVLGYTLAMLPVLRSGLSLRTAIGVVLAADTASILTVKVVDNTIMLSRSGCLRCRADRSVVLGSLVGSLVVAFVMTVPVNRAMIARGKGHAVAHHTTTDQECTIQTFLPYADFTRSAAILDDKRLGKQRVETLQIFQVLVGLRWNRTGATPLIEVVRAEGVAQPPGGARLEGLRGEPARLSARRMRSNGRSAGFADTCLASTLGLFEASGLPIDPKRPAWVDDPAVHRSHQSNLIRKDPVFYRPLFPACPMILITSGRPQDEPEIGAQPLNPLRHGRSHRLQALGR